MKKVIKKKVVTKKVAKKIKIEITPVEYEGVMAMHRNSLKFLAKDNSMSGHKYYFHILSIASSVLIQIYGMKSFKKMMRRIYKDNSEWHDAYHYPISKAEV